MPPVRFRLRTMMGLVAVASVVMAVLRAILFLYDAIGFNLLYSVVADATLFVYVPLVLIVESVFFVFYFWLRRKRTRRVLTIGRITTPEPRASGEPKRV